MTIRPIHADDLQRVLEINEANVPEVGSIRMDRLQFLVDASEIALVAEAETAHGTTVAGFCLVLGQESSYDSVNYRWFMERYSDCLYLDRVAFDAAFQGRGFGTAIYAEIDRQIEQRRSEGAVIARLTLEVNVNPPNEQSLAFHDRRGFTEVGRQDTPYGIQVSMMHKPY